MTPPSLWSRIFQWATPFRLENPDMTLDDVAKRINDLDRPKDTFFSSNTIVASASKSLVDNQYFFSMARTRQLRYGWINSAELSGIMTRDPETDATVVGGIVKMGTGALNQALLFAGITALLLLATRLPGADAVWLGLLFSIPMTLYYIAAAAGDRGELLTIMQKIVNTRLPDRSKRKNLLEESEETTHLVDLATNEPIETNALGVVEEQKRARE